MIHILFQQHFRRNRTNVMNWSPLQFFLPERCLWRVSPSESLSSSNWQFPSIGLSLSVCPASTSSISFSSVSVTSSLLLGSSAGPWVADKVTTRFMRNRGFDKSFMSVLCPSGYVWHVISRSDLQLTATDWNCCGRAGKSSPQLPGQEKSWSRWGASPDDRQKQNRDQLNI